jgi:DNA-3-methyladenine glycosylase
LQINKSLNGQNLAESNQLWIEDDGKQPGIFTSRRIGIDYASEEDKNRLWRFRVKN